MSTLPFKEGKVGLVPQLVTIEQNLCKKSPKPTNSTGWTPLPDELKHKIIRNVCTDIPDIEDLGNLMLNLSLPPRTRLPVPPPFNGRKEDKRDTARRKRHVDKAVIVKRLKIRKKKHIRIDYEQTVFDGTLGYPGEGPSRNPRKMWKLTIPSQANNPYVQLEEAKIPVVQELKEFVDEPANGDAIIQIDEVVAPLPLIVDGRITTPEMASDATDFKDACDTIATGVMTQADMDAEAFVPAALIESTSSVRTVKISQVETKIKPPTTESTQQPASKKLCRNWAKGKCDYESKHSKPCMFDHPERVPSQVCKHWKNGVCAYEKKHKRKCKFEHPAEAQIDKICRQHAKTGKCTYGDKCKFKHTDPNQDESKSQSEVEPKVTKIVANRSLQEHEVDDGDYKIPDTNEILTSQATRNTFREMQLKASTSYNSTEFSEFSKENEATVFSNLNVIARRNKLSEHYHDGAFLVHHAHRLGRDQAIVMKNAWLKYTATHSVEMTKTQYVATVLRGHLQATSGVAVRKFGLPPHLSREIDESVIHGSLTDESRVHKALVTFRYFYMTFMLLIIRPLGEEVFRRFLFLLMIGPLGATVGDGTIDFFFSSISGDLGLDFILKHEANPFYVFQRYHLIAIIAVSMLMAHLDMLSGKYSLSRPGLLTEFILRTVAHFVLHRSSFWLALAVHILWNALFTVVNPYWCLRIQVLGRGAGAFPSITRKAICCGDYTSKGMPFTIHKDFKVVWGESVCKDKFGTRTFFGVHGTQVHVFGNCSCNEVRSLISRVGKQLPLHKGPVDHKGETVAMYEARKAWGNMHDSMEVLLRLVKPVTKGYKFENWLESFPPQKKARLIRSKENGFEDWGMRASGFIKRENAGRPDHVIEFHEHISDPRWIQGCPSGLSGFCGPHTRKLAKHVREGLRPLDWCQGAIREGRQVIYTCGMSNEVIGFEFGNAHGLIGELCDADDQVTNVEDDQSRFDMHLRKGPFNFLNRFYQKTLRAQVAERLRRKTAKGRSGLGTKYSVPFTMQSGWPDTSVGDTLLNAAMKYEICGVGKLWISIVCGDDSITITTENTLASWGGILGLLMKYAIMGMEVKVKASTDYIEVEFCSGRFFATAGTFVLVPKVGKLLARLVTDRVDRTHENQIAWLRGMSHTLLHFGQLDPLLQALGENIAQRCGSGKVINEAYNEYKHRYEAPLSCTRSEYLYYAYRHYNLSAEAVDRLTETLRTTELGLIHSSSLLQMALNDL